MRLTKIKWFAYWTVGLVATVGVILAVLETRGHTLGGTILAGVGMVALFGFVGMMAQSVWEDIYK